MEKHNSCLNSLAIIQYIEDHAPDKTDMLFHGLDKEMYAIPDKKAFLSDPNNWVSSTVIIKLYENAKKILKDENIAYRVGYQSIVEKRFGYVQKILIYAFGNPKNILSYSQRINDKFNKTKSISLESLHSDNAVVRLHWRPELELSRDFCLYNKGIYSAIPSVWGGDACRIQETKCFFDGDPYCEYRLHWKPQSRFKDKLFHLIAPWKIARESIRELEKDKQLLQEKYEKIYALNKDLENKISQLSALHETSTAVLSTLDLKELLNKVLERMMHIAKLERAGVFLTDQSGKKLKLIHAAGIDQKTLKALQDYHIPIDKKNNIIARAAQAQKPIMVQDVGAITLNRKNPLLKAFKPKAFVIVPMSVRNQVVGIMIGDNVSEPDFIKEIDRDFLTSFANHIAMAIENANLYRRIETSEKKHRQIVENINEGIMIINEEGTVVFSNRKMKTLIGKDDLQDSRLYEFVPQKKEKRKLLSLLMANYSGLQAKEEIMFRSTEGRDIPALMSSVPIQDPNDGTMLGCLALVTDLTSQKDLERRLLQAQKMESIGTMAGGIAHDFNNILTGILGFTSLLKEKVDDRPDLARFVEIIENSSLRAAALVKKMLVFSREAAVQEDASSKVNDVVQESFALLKSSFPKNISIDLRLAENLPDILCDSSQLQQIILNLCINARDAMPEGGRIAISTSLCPPEELPLSLKGRAGQDSFLKLQVTDTGTGISREIIDRIFDPFFTTKEVGKGSGLGLAMVYGIIESLGGKIEVNSTKGRGTCFDLYFKLAKNRQETPDQRESEQHFSGTETILIADDEELVRDLACEILRPYGYRTIMAKNGKEAVSIYRSLFPEIRLVIMDVVMPEMDGIQAAKEILKSDPGARILFCSGYSSGADLPEIQHRQPSTMFIKKPFNPESLLKAVRRSLDANLLSQRISLS
ncbi:MAG: hypothetical protein DSZ23_04735 [Thermodesulfatator sp.]|nr:MAG: hypothetical protein DSZ23_04735 [Thermodesulfatator sp.]